MKYYIIVGEPSGDLHASNLMKQLKEVDTNADFRYFGGDLMKKQGGTIVKHYKELAFMGFWEVLKNLGTVNKNIKLCKQDIIDYNPDHIILVDYPGFNLRIAEFAKNKGFKVNYYISPKIWAWKKRRIKKIKRLIDKMFVIFPFEVDFYKTHNYNVEYVGNPSVNTVDEELSKPLNRQKFLTENKLDEKPIIALLPGSRVQEINKMLPIMSNVSEKFPQYQFVVAGMSSLPEDLYINVSENYSLKIVIDKTFELMRHSYAAVVTSGTATLETALFKVPQVVCYKTSKMSYSIGKLFVKISYFSLVNILMQKQVIVELLQNNLENDIIKELNKLVADEDYRKQIIDNYNMLEEQLGKKNAPENIAKSLLNN